jgi:hypothetical protein
MTNYGLAAELARISSLEGHLDDFLELRYQIRKRKD